MNKNYLTIAFYAKFFIDLLQSGDFYYQSFFEGTILEFFYVYNKMGIKLTNYFSDLISTFKEINSD